MTVSSPPFQPHPHTSEPTRVLIVEDNDDYAALVERTLTHFGDAEFSVDRASCLDSALGRIECRPYDAILLDLGLPDGYGAFTLGSACTLASELPIVVLTAQDDELTEQTARRAGAQDYLVKHRVDRRILPRAILGAIEKHRSGRPARRAHEGEQKLLERIDQSIESTRDAATATAVLVVGYDDFEVMRYVFGDRLCREMHRCADLIVHEVDSCSSFVSPIGDGSFGVLLEEVRSDGAMGRVAARLLRSLAEVEMCDDLGFAVSGITASVGIAVHPWDGDRAETLLESARQAQKSAARAGGSRYRFYRKGEYV